MSKTKVAFICVHNSCRSQIAEALGKHLAGDKFDFLFCRYRNKTTNQSRCSKTYERTLQH